MSAIRLGGRRTIAPALAVPEASLQRASDIPCIERENQGFRDYDVRIRLSSFCFTGMWIPRFTRIPSARLPFDLMGCLDRDPA